MLYDGKVWIGTDQDTNERVSILPQMANRHGLIAGATGTGKTITLKVLAESLSEAGVPVFLSDVKGDLAGMVQPGADSPDMQKRREAFGLDAAGFRCQSFPTVFWDIEGIRGLPLRTTISEMGPTLLSRLLEISDLQADILTIIFRIADENKLLLLDTKDLRAMLQHVAENTKEYSSEYGNMSAQSINAILRAVVALETAGGDRFFGEPAVDIHDFFRTDAEGRGTINILDAASTIRNPLIYSTFMLYMMSELFEQLPEVGDPDKPKMVFFFDEAHLLFDGAPKALLNKIEQVVKLVRSKGVGIFFITQNPSDIPDSILAQLGNKVQHALRAYTPAEEKKIRSAAESFRANPAFDTEKVLMNLGTGEALVSVLDAKGCPEMARRCRILPPESRMGAIDDIARKRVIGASDLSRKYDESVDRDSAYEFLKRKTALTEEQLQKEKDAAAQAKQDAKTQAAEEKEAAKAQEKADREAEKEKKERMTAIKGVGRSTAGTLGREVGYAVGKSVFGNSFGRRIGGNIGAALGRGILNTLFGGR